MFALSCDGFVLLIFEALNIGVVETRLNFWVLTLGLLVYLSILVVPAILIYKTVRKISQNRSLKIGKTSNYIKLEIKVKFFFIDK